MKNKFFSFITAVTLSLSISNFSSNATAEYGTKGSKISLKLQNTLDLIDSNELIPICIWFDDINYETVNKITFLNTGLLEESIMNSSYEIYKKLDNNIIQKKEEKFNQDYIVKEVESFSSDNQISGLKEINVNELETIKTFFNNNYNDICQLSFDTDTYINEKRAVARDEYKRHNNAFVDEYLEDVDILFISSYAPMVIGETTKNKINELKDIDTVEALFLYSVFDGQDFGNIDVSVPSIGGDYTRDTMGCNGYGVKIGQIESGRPQYGISELANTTITRGGTNNNTYHASLVASIIAGTTGMVPQAHLYSTTADNFYQNAEWLISSGVTVINCSYGSYNNGLYDYKAKWVDHIVNQHNVTWVQASGNAGPNGYVCSYGNAYNAITVGAIDDNGTVNINDDTYASFTSYNLLVNAMAMKPDVLAPGVGFSVSGVTPDDGTSYAAPHVTGMIAQMICYIPSLGLRPDAIKAAVLACCDRKVSGETMVWITDKEGAGVVNAINAINFISNISSQQTYYNTTASSMTFYYNPQTQGTKTVAISWLKQNTGSGVNHESVNNSLLTDFDLRVYDNSTGVVIASSLSSYNNAELVRFFANTNSTYTIEITRYSNNSTLEKLSIAYL